MALGSRGACLPPWVGLTPLSLPRSLTSMQFKGLGDAWVEIGQLTQEGGWLSGLGSMLSLHGLGFLLGHIYGSRGPQGMG